MSNQLSRLHISIAGIALLCLGNSIASAQSLYLAQEEEDASPDVTQPTILLEEASMYFIEGPEIRSIQKHDIITIIIDENSSQTSSQKLETEKESKSNANVNALLSVAQLLELRLEEGGISNVDLVDFTSKREFSGEGDYERKDKFTARIAAIVLEVKPNGTLGTPSNQTHRQRRRNLGACALRARPRREPIQNALSNLMNQLDDLASQISLYVNDVPGTESAAIASPMINQLESLRDQAAIAHDRLSRLHRIDALAIKRALETGEALLVIGPPSQGVAAVDLDALLPSSKALEQAGISAAGIIGPRAQDLIATALAQLVAPTQPILIFVHGSDSNQLLSNPDILAKTVAKLAAKGIDTLEWAPLDDPTPPNIDAIDPLGIRPIVYSVLSVDSSAGSGETGLSGAKRATEMGKVLAQLIEQGESVIVSLSPSIFPTSRLADPIASALAPFGIYPDSARPLMHDQIGTLGRIADPITQTIPSNNEHIIANAMNGLNTVLPWAIPLETKPITGVELFTIIDLVGSDETWAEQDWLGLWRMPTQSRTLARNQPSYEPAEDLQQANWSLAIGAQRSYLGLDQRIITVGSNGWLTDSITTNNEQLIDGRIVSRWPGNMTMLESSVLWLAGMDDLIGPGTQAKPIATIKNLDPSQRSMLRWLILAGLPGIILILGMISRWVFG